MGKKIDFHDGIDWHHGKINFSFKEDCFTAQLPTEAVKALGCGKQVSGKTVKECEEAWRFAIRRWRGLKITKRKAIFYEFEASERPNTGKKKDWSRSTAEKTWNDFYDCNEVKGDWRGIRFRWSVGNLIEFDNKKLFAKEEGKETALDKDSKVIDWSQEREDFCRGLDRALSDLAVRAGAFFDMETREICARIDAKTLPLLLEMEGHHGPKR